MLHACRWLALPRDLTDGELAVLTLKPGDIVILGNPGSGTGEAVPNDIRAAGARILFLPLYSPDLNPAEHVFARLKTLLRKAAQRSVEGTWQRIGSLRQKRFVGARSRIVPGIAEPARQEGRNDVKVQSRP